MLVRYLITGATGYIGSMLTKYLRCKNYDSDITAIVRDADKAKNILPEGVNCIVSDITDTVNMSMINEDYDYIIHCASETKSKNMV